MNTEALLEVKEQILADPAGFYMEDWFCQTTMCIGGQLVTNAGWSEISPESEKCRHEIFGDRRISEVACEILEIPYRQGIDLFHVSNWPERERQLYIESLEVGDRTGMAHAAADRIDRFIEDMKDKEDEACAVA